MFNLNDVIALDFAYLETFTHRIDTNWGSLFFNENQPLYYDANHAHIDKVCENPQLVIDEVINFYKAKEIIPRFYIYNLHLQQDLLSKLQENHFGYEELEGPVQIWDQRVIELSFNEKITVELVTDKNYEEALDIECSIKEFGGRAAIEKMYEEQFRHPNFTHYLLRYDGKACSTACVFEKDHQARLEHVATLEEFRGKGLIGYIIQHIQKEVLLRGIEKFWVMPINELVEKVYARYGFKTVGKFKMGHAFLGGKSILEIRE